MSSRNNFLFLILMTLIPLASAFGQRTMTDGGGAGGGGADVESRFYAAAWDILNELERNLHRYDTETVRVIKAVLHMARTSPAKVRETQTLLTCNTKEPVKDNVTAWGCPGLIQLKPEFNYGDEALIFHELTRATKDFEKSDEGMVISTGKLQLVTPSEQVTITKLIFPKNKHFRRDVMGPKAESLYYNAGAIACRTEEDAENMYITVVWPRLGRTPKMHFILRSEDTRKH